jgi:hypothetical protein
MNVAVKSLSNLKLLAPSDRGLAVLRTGTFNLHTLSGNVVVNNIVATHFGTSTSWSPLGRSLATYWYHAVNAVSSVVGAEDASAAKHNNLRAAQ